MRLRPGQLLGGYEILAPLGVGGMGEVYRARDRRLGREVAVKVLPESFTPTRVVLRDEAVDLQGSHSPERLARFEREAKVLASLHHPNIATLFGLEEEEDLVFLVMELVEGETLDERICRRPLALAEAVEIFLQIAEGLEAAHEKGITHRDLKPSNVKITPEATVKILDFGLATALRAEPEHGQGEAASSRTSSLTLSYSASDRSAMRGTVGYMSPEQARGRRVDRRTDIWSFGCCLYESLTGRKAFHGDTVSDILSEILKGEPSWSRLPAGTPEALRRLLWRCLDKDRRRRLQHIGDARLELEEARSGSPRLVESAAGRRRLERRTVALGLAGAVVAGLLAGAVVSTYLTGEADSATRSVKRLAIHLPDEAPLSFRDVLPMALSPDGEDLVYAGRREGSTLLYHRPLDSLDVRLLPGTGGARNPFFSPDGEWVGFLLGNLIKKVPLAGGGPVTVIEAPEPVMAAWGPDDFIIYSNFRDGLYRVPAAGGEAERLTSVETGLTEHLLPVPEPSGRFLLFSTFVPLATVQLEVLDLETRERGSLGIGTAPHFLGEDLLVFARDGDLWVAPFDADALSLGAAPVRAIEGALHTAVPYPQMAVSREGTLLYLPGGVMGLERRLVWVTAAGEEMPLDVPPRDYGFPSLSPTGSRLAVSVYAEGNSDVWIYDFGRSAMRRFTFDAGNEIAPLWTPDGSRLVFSCTQGNPVARLCWKAADGSGETEPLTTSANLQLASSFTPAGTELLFMELNPETGWDVRLLSLEEGFEVRTVLGEPEAEAWPALSPDGRWMAYERRTEGSRQIFVRPFPEVGGGLWQVSPDTGQEPGWSPNGRTLFYRSGGSIVSVPLGDEETFEAGAPQRLFQEAGLYDDRTLYDVAPDGRFLMVKETGFAASAARSREILVVQNWDRELAAMLSPSP